MFSIDINEELNVSDLSDKFPKVFPPETGQNKTLRLRILRGLKKNQRPKVQLLKMVIQNDIFALKQFSTPVKI